MKLLYLLIVSTANVVSLVHANSLKLPLAAEKKAKDTLYEEIFDDDIWKAAMGASKRAKSGEIPVPPPFIDMEIPEQPLMPEKHRRHPVSSSLWRYNYQKSWTN